MLALVGNRPNRFGPKEIAQAESFRDQALIAIENARLFNETQEALEQQKASADVLGAISKSVADTAPVFETILDACQRLFGSEEIGIYTIGDDDMVRAAAWRGPRAEEARRDVTPLAESVTGRVIRERRTAPHPRSRRRPRSVRRRCAIGWTAMAARRSSMRRCCGRTAGSARSLVVRWPPRPFSEREQALLQSFADQAAIAIQNARLFDEVQSRTRDLSEALQQQTATAEVLKVISRSAFDLGLATSTILEAAGETLRAPLATLHLRDGDVCRRVTQFGMPEAFERQARENPIPVRYAAALAPAGASRARSRITPTRGTIPTISTRGPPNWPAIARSSSIPLMREDEVVGVFSLGRPEPEPFTPSQIELVQTFADQAVIAIENARLFDEVQARTAT